jgi:hypothetical protein
MKNLDSLNLVAASLFSILSCTLALAGCTRDDSLGNNTRQDASPDLEVVTRDSGPTPDETPLLPDSAVLGPDAAPARDSAVLGPDAGPALLPDSAVFGPDAHATADSPATFEAFPEDGAPKDIFVPQPADGGIDASSVDGNDGDTPISADGSAPGIDARTVMLPDGRTLTYLDVCQQGPLSSSDLCPQSYALGLAAAQAKLQSPPDGGRPPMPGQIRTGAGRCAEGSYVYGPFLDLSSELCYYDAATQLLVGHVYYSDYPIECGQRDIFSNVLVRGAMPPCSTIAWEVYGIATYY